MTERPAPLLLERLVALHRALQAGGVAHCVGGAIALAVHVQEPRFTADIDLNVMAEPEEPERLFGMLPAELVVHSSAAAEVRADGQTRLMWPSPDTPVDLFLPQHDTYHQLVTDRAEPTDFLGDDILVMTATDLMVFKALFDRSKDWVDIESLVDNDAGDVTEAVGWLTEFVGADDSRTRRLCELGTT